MLRLDQWLGFSRSSDIVILLLACAVFLAFVVVASPSPRLVGGSSSTSCSSCVPE